MAAINVLKFYICTLMFFEFWEHWWKANIMTFKTRYYWLNLDFYMIFNESWKLNVVVLKSKEFLKVSANMELNWEFCVENLKLKLCDMKLRHVVFQTLLVSYNLDVCVIFVNFQRNWNFKWNFMYMYNFYISPYRIFE